MSNPTKGNAIQMQHMLGYYHSIIITGVSVHHRSPHDAPPVHDARVDIPPSVPIPVETVHAQCTFPPDHDTKEPTSRRADRADDRITLTENTQIEHVAPREHLTNLECLRGRGYVFGSLGG